MTVGQAAENIRQQLESDRLQGELRAAITRASNCPGWEILPCLAKAGLVLHEIVSMEHCLREVNDNTGKLGEKLQANQDLIKILGPYPASSAMALFGM